MSVFVPGLELSRQFYVEAVRPALDSAFPSLPHAAGLLGRGSEVLGYDDEMSTDHDWKPRVVIFLRDDQAKRRGDVDEVLRRGLPPRFRDLAWDLEINTVHHYFRDALALDVRGKIEARDWLTLPEHGLRMFTSGEVFHDDVGLGVVRDRLSHYPHDVWLYLLMAGWWRVHPEANLVGRAGSVGDELGSALIGSRLVSDLMRLCFLMERQYAPYTKWFGTAFSRLSCGPELTPILWRVVQADTWQSREDALLAAYEKLAQMHNALHVTAPLSTDIEQMWDRPFRVTWADFPGLLREQIQDPAVAAVADQWPVGPVDQFRDLLWPSTNRELLLRLFD